MTTATISIPENEDRILNIIKAKYGFKNKEQAIIFLLKEYEKQRTKYQSRHPYL